MLNYRHYKTQNIYTFICVGINTKDNTDIVIYENEEGLQFSRPAEEFFGMVEVDGNIIRRFQLDSIESV